MALYGGIGEVERRGHEALMGEIEVEDDEVISTPFAHIDSVTLTLKGGSTPGLGAAVLTYDVDDSDVEILAWRPTSSSNPTLIANNSPVTVSYLIMGRRR